MKHRTRLLLCRLGFMLLCALPTATVISWIVLRTIGGFGVASKAEWQQALTSRLGLIAEINEVHYPEAGLAQLTGCKLLDPETRKLVAEADRLEIADTSEGWQVAAEQVIVEANQLRRLAQLLDERILRGPSPSTASESAALQIHFLPRDILLRQSQHQQTLARFGGRALLAANRVSLECQFQIPGGNASEQPIRLVAVRDRTQTPPVTSWLLDTGGVDIPLALADGLLPNLNCLGRECRFRGATQATDSAGEISGRLRGMLTHVDLDSLVTEHFPHQLSGVATVQIDEATIEHSKLAALRGTLQAASGTISPSLVAAAKAHLGVNTADESHDPNSSANLPFRPLVIAFDLDGRSLSLTGKADPLHAGVLLTSAAGPILTAPPQHSVAAMNLLRTLLPGNEYQVPATRQTDALVRLFPLPEIVPAKAGQQPQHTPTRLIPRSDSSPQTAVRPPVLR